MAELQTEMSPVDGQISNDVPGTVRVASATQGGAVIVTDENTLANKLPGLLAGIAKTDFSVSSADISGRQWPSVDGSLNFTWNTVSGRTVTKNSDHISYVETRGSTSAGDSILCDISSVTAQPECTGFTIEVDFKIPDATPGSDYGRWFSVFGIGKDGGNQTERCVLSVGFDRDARKLDIHYINQTSKYSSPSALDLSNRIKVMASWDGANFYLFVNGEKVRSVACEVANFSVFKKLTLGHAEQGTSQTKVEFYSVTFTPKAVTDPSYSLVNSGFKNFTLNENIDNFVSEAMAPVKRSLESKIFAKSFMVFEGGEKHPGFLSAISRPSYRIPTICVTNKNTLLAFSDYRKDAGDQTLIQSICARSLNGGTSWNYSCIGTAEGTNGVRRVMDPTVLLNTSNNHVFLLLGHWQQSGQNWCQDATANAWVSDGKKAVILKSTDDGATFVQKTLSPAANSASNVQINGMPAECKGFLGGVGAGIRTSDGKLIFPIQWTPGGGAVYSTIIYSENNGDTWNWGAGKIQDATMDPAVGGWGSAEHMVVEMPDGKIVSLSRTAGASVVGPKRAFYTEDLGATWHQYTPLDRKVPKGAECQGSFIKIETVKGVTCYLITAPSCSSSSGIYRSGVSLYVFRYNSQDPDASTVVPIYDLNVPQSGGYSSLAYMKHPGGEKLVSIVEVNGEIEKSSKIEDLTFLIARIEQLSEEGSIAVDAMRSEVSSLSSQVSALDVKVDNYDARISTLELGGETEDVYLRNGKVASFFVSGLNPDTKDWVSQEGNLTFKATSAELSAYSPKTSGVSLSTNDSSLIRVNSPSNDDATILRVENFNPSSIFTNNEATVQFKLRINTRFSGNWHTTLGMFVNSLTNATNYRIGLAYNKDDMRQIMNCCRCGAGAQNASTLSSQIPLEETMFVTLSYGEKFKLFINNKKLLEKDKAGNGWAFNEANQFVIGNKPDNGRVVDMEIGDLLIYNRELTEDEVFKNFCAGMKVEPSVGFINDLTTENKSNVVDAINEIKPGADIAMRIGSQVPLYNLSRQDADGRFLNNTSIDAGGGTWTSNNSSTTLNVEWTTAATKVTNAKTDDGLSVTIVNGHLLTETPKINVSSELADATGFSVRFKVKHTTSGLPDADYSQWFGIFGIKHADGDSPLYSMCGNRGELRNRGYFDLKILKDAANPETNYGVSSKTWSHAGSMNIGNYVVNGFNDYIVVFDGTNCYTYCNGRKFSEKSCAIADFTKIGTIVFDDFTCYNGNNNNKAKNTFSEVTLFKKALSQDEITTLFNLENDRRTVIPEWYDDLYTLLTALQQRP